MRKPFQFGESRNQEEKTTEPRHPHVEIATRQDLMILREDLLEALSKLKQVPTVEVNPKVQKRFLKTGELMRLLGLSRNTVNDLRNSNAIPAVRVHGIYLFEISDVEKFIEENKR